MLACELLLDKCLKRSSFFCFRLVINKAYKALEDETTRKKCMDVVEEAKFKVDSAVCIYLFSAPAQYAYNTVK